MADFARAIALVLKHEGGYVDDPIDPGGETKYGISRRTYPDLDIRNLTIDQATAIYKKDYWDQFHFELIPYDLLAAKVFDIGVNVGCVRAIRFMQEGAVELGAAIGIDGIIGGQTVVALGGLAEDTLLDRFRANAESYYVSLNQPHFLKGWLNRLNDE